MHAIVYASYIGVYIYVIHVLYVGYVYTDQEMSAGSSSSPIVPQVWKTSAQDVDHSWSRKHGMSSLNCVSNF